MSSHLWVLVITLLLLPSPGYSASYFGRHEQVVRQNHPIVFLPGKGGNQLEAKLRKPSSENCPTVADWHRTWLDVWTFLKDGVECWAENMHLQFNPMNKSSTNAEGVETRVPGWGTTHGMEYIDSSWIAWFLGNIGIYIAYLVRELMLHGYVRDVNIRGAPYDFRYAPHSQADYFLRLERLIEETYDMNNHTKVVLVGHSLGGLFSTYFLNNKSQEWKDRYIASMVTVNTPWAGSVRVTNMYTAGHNFNIDAIDRLVIRDSQRSYETGIFLLPKQPAWSPNDVIVQTPQRNFTIDDYVEFFNAINYTVGAELMEKMNTSEYQLSHPGVPVHCFFSRGIPTPERLVYAQDSEFPDGSATMIMGDGDGSVNVRSLRVCEQWTNNSVYPSNMTQLERAVKHNDVLFDMNFMTDLLEITRLK